MRGMFAVLALLAAPAVAQEEGSLRVGADLYRAGGTVVLTKGAVGEVFLAGETVRTEAPVAGSAHLAGRRVTAGAPVEGSLYAAGMDVAVTGPVADGATLAGYEVIVGAEVGGGLRATGRLVRVEAPIGGSAVLGGQEVVLDAPVQGDAAIVAETLAFGEAARIAGRLVLYGEPEDMAAVPGAVVPADRIELRAADEWQEESRAASVSSVTAVAGFLVGVLVTALLALAAALVAPFGIEVLRDEVALGPFRSLGLGFLALSTLVGAAVIVALTIVGLLLVPAVVIAAVLLGVAGYIVAIYMLGAGLTEWWRRREPARLGERALAALVGAAVAGLILLVPFLGWLFMLAAVLVGTGALARAALGSRFAGARR